MSELAPTDASADLAARSPFLQALVAPISPDNPAGDDVTYDDDFQRIKTEVDNLGSAGGSTDFELIAALSRKVLTTKAKDLRVATYLAMGLTQTQGLRGAAEGVGAVRVLTETFWETAHPPLKRAAARRNALQALSDRLKEWVAAEKPSADDREVLEQGLADMKALQAFVMGAMDDQAPAVSGLTRAFEEALRRAPKPEPTAPPSSDGAAGGEASAAAPLATPAARPPAPSLAPSQAAPGTFRSVAEAERTAFRLAAYLREQDRASPVPFKLVRAVRWGALGQEPPATDGKTLLPAPPEQRRTFLAGLLERGEFARLVDEVEETFQEAPFWLDLQRLVVLALDGLGGPYALVRDAVLYEFAVLVGRFPGLVELTFSDGTPLADAATQNFVEMRVAPVLAQGESAAAATVAGSSEALAASYGEALKRLGSDDLAGALALMMEGAEQDLTRQDRFRRRYYSAVLCLRGGQPAVAYPMLEELVRGVEAYGLDDWDPPLALEVWASLHRCCTLMAAAEPDVPAFRTRGAEAFERVCRLDARHALTLVGKR